MSEPDRHGDVSSRASADPHVAVVEIHRPPANYFDATLIADLATALEDLDASGWCRAVVLCSEGRHFCAGADFTGTSGHPLGSLGSSDHPLGSIGSLYEQALRLARTALPVVAAVQGAAVGGGLGLALMADFRVATPASHFAANFARIGFHHGFGISVTLTEVVGRQMASEMLYTGRRVPGEEAARAGLCDRLVPEGELREAAGALASEIAAAAPLAVRAIRRTMRHGLADRLAEALERERAEQEALVGSADFAEGVRANAERRVPRFEGH